MHPISKERAKFVGDRIRVLNAMYTELLQRPAKFIVGQADVQRAALTAIQAEKLMLMVELDVLVTHLESVQASKPIDV